MNVLCGCGEDERGRGRGAFLFLEADSFCFKGRILSFTDSQWATYKVQTNLLNYDVLECLGRT